MNKISLFFLAIPFSILISSMNSFHKKNEVKITQFGFACCKIELDSITVYVDIFSEVIDTSNLQSYADADIILITHDDHDHFSSKQVTEIARLSNSLIIGPPSVTYPLLAENNLNAEKLKVFYPPTSKEYFETTINDIKMRIYQTTHFNEWRPIHISYLIEYNNIKIFISGDSYSYLEDDLLNDSVDIFLANMVEDKEDLNHYIKRYKQIDNQMSYKYLLPCHLIDCNFTISPLSLKKEISNMGVTDVIIQQDENDVFIYKKNE